MKANPYETTRYLNEYLLFHYGRLSDLCPHDFVPRDWLRFHLRLREDYLLPIAGDTASFGLDIGCAVGRFTFELSQVMRHVIGVDNSAAFIKAARRVAKRHKLSVLAQESGATLTRHELALTRVRRSSSVEFQVGDALDLTGFTNRSFQVVSAINLLDRLPCPRRFLEQMPKLVSPGGQLLLASPFSWLEQFTPRSEWLTSQKVRSILHQDFRLKRHGELPFVIREHRRKYQLVVSEVFTFIRQG